MGSPLFMLQFDYPLYYVVGCLALAVGFTYILYFIGRKSLSNTWNWVLAAIRFTSVFFISLFLLHPLLKFVTTETEKPLLIVGVDNSLSVLQNKDSLFYKNEFGPNLKEKLGDLANKYDVKYFQFGESTEDWGDSIRYESKQTDIAGFIQNIEEYYGFQNMGAVVLATDGLYNKGRNPEYVENRIKAPLYTLAMGDSAQTKDQWISAIRKNKIAFLGNEFPIEVSLQSTLLSGVKSKLTIQAFGRTLKEEEITYTKQDEYVKIQFSLKAEKLGNQAIRIILQNEDGESTYKNNQELVFIDVLDSRQRILLLSSVTHPDVAALRSAITNNENFEVDYFPVRNLADLKLEEVNNKYSLIILNQIPSLKNNGPLLDGVLKSDVPKLFVLGKNSDINKLNTLQLGLKLNGANGKLNEVQGQLNSAFSPFLMDKEGWAYLQEAPPLQVPFGQYSISNLEVLFYQRIGSVATDYPLWMLGTNNGLKVGVIAGEGLWRWRLFTNDQGSSKSFDEIIDKTVNYLATKERKSRFRVDVSKRIQENEPLVFEAEFYNASFELDNGEDVLIEVMNEIGDKYDFVMNRLEKSYYLNAGFWEPGTYKYTMSTTDGGKKYEAKGEIAVSPVSVEFLNNRANVGLLSRLSKRNNGEMIAAKDMDLLISTLSEIKAPSTSIEETRFEDLINLKWIFFLILGLLGLEWFVRKREGVV